MLCFLLPRCMYHQGCTRAQRPAGKASWPAALCTSSLLHIWMYLRSTTNHQNHYTSQRPMIQPHSSTIFLCCTTMKPTYLKSQQKILNLTDDEEWKKNAGREERETKGKQFKTFRKRQILVWLGIEPTPPALLGARQASLHSAWW